MMLNDDNARVPRPPKISREAAGICRLFRLIDTRVFALERAFTRRRGGIDAGSTRDRRRFPDTDYNRVGYPGFTGNRYPNRDTRGLGKRPADAIDDVADNQRINDGLGGT